MNVAVAIGLVVLAVPSLCRAQTATGTVAGVVRGPSDAVLGGARVQAVSRATGEVRWTLTTERGEYSLPALLPGEYEVSVTIEHVATAVRAASVAAGTTTTVDFAVLVGSQTDSITVDAAAPRLRYESAAVGGVISRDLLEAVMPGGGGRLLAEQLRTSHPGIQVLLFRRREVS